MLSLLNKSFEHEDETEAFLYDGIVHLMHKSFILLYIMMIIIVMISVQRIFEILHIIYCLYIGL